MTWEEKFAAINALSEAMLRMIEPGHWRVYHPHVSIKQGSFLISVAAAGGVSPEMAVEAWWHGLTDISQDKHIVIIRDQKWRAVRWNGFMWEDLQEPA